MLSFTLQSPGELIFDDIPEPVLKDNEALIEVKSVGICALDIAPYKGIDLELTPLPMVPGHEFGGIVKEIKGDTEKIKIGDKVAIYPLIPCGSCYYCNHGLRLSCEKQTFFGSQGLAGAMVERIAVPIDNCIKLPDGFDIRYAALIEPITVANHAIGKIKDSNIVIVGAGSIGMLMLEIAKTRNNKVIAIDIDENHLKLAKKLKADLALNFRDTEKNKKIESFLGKDMVDVVVLAFTCQDILDWAMETVRKYGSIINVATLDKRLEIDFWQLVIKAVTIRGVESYTFEEFEEAVRMIESGIIHTERIATKMFPISQSKEAYEFKAKKNPLKVIIIN